MRMFVLQNRDFTEMYWSSEYGWADIEHADFFFGTELDGSECLRLMEETNGKWVLADYMKFDSTPRDSVYF